MPVRTRSKTTRKSKRMCSHSFHLGLGLKKVPGLFMVTDLYFGYWRETELVKMI